MDQYFEHIDKRSQSSKYPPRIRFMLRDLIELRANCWVPRKSATTEAPVPMQQLRPDDNDPPFANNKRDNPHNQDRDSDSWLSKSQFNYQPNSNYNSPLIMNNMYNMNQYNSPVSGNYNSRDSGKFANCHWRQAQRTKYQSNTRYFVVSVHRRKQWPWHGSS